MLAEFEMEIDGLSNENAPRPLVGKLSMRNINSCKFKRIKEQGAKIRCDF